MPILEAYDGQPRVVSFAKTDEVAADLMQQGLSAAVLRNAHLVFSTDQISYPISKESLPLFESYNDYDVLSIAPNGAVYRLYNAASEDNGIVVTEKCNSNCIMCPSPEISRRNGSSADIVFFREFIKHISSDAPHLTITGGEPFLIGESIFLLFQSLKEQLPNTEFLLLTNGRIAAVPQYCLKIKETLPERTVIGIPLHGDTAELHDQITQVKGSFHQTVVGIKNLLQLGLHVEIRIVVSRLNAHRIDRICQLIINELKNVLRVKVIGLEMLGNAAKNQDKVWIPYRDAFLASKSGVLQLIRSGIDVGLYNFPLCSVDRMFWPLYEKSISDYKIRFAESCNTCAVKNNCGGLFSGTIRLAGKDVIPFGA